MCQYLPLLSLLLCWLALGQVDPETDARRWCQHISTTPEPSVLFYNRIPKCGSSTMIDIIKRQIKVMHKPIYYYYLSSQWWSSYAMNGEKDKLYNYLKIRFFRDRNAQMRVVVGHTNFFPFSTRKVGQDSMEYMQVRALYW